MPLLPASHDERKSTDDLKRDAAQQGQLDHAKTVYRAGSLHERDVCGRASQSGQVIGDVQAHEGYNENSG